MARCGCGSTCSCLVQGDGDTTTVVGNGSPGNPFIVTALLPDASGTGFRTGAGATSVIGGDLDTTATSTGTNSLAIGNGADALANAALAVGPNSSADGIASVAVGSQATTEDDGAVAVGQQATARNANDICIGKAAGTIADVSKTDSVVIGHSASSTASGGIAIGASASAGDTGANSQAVAIGELADSLDRGVAIGANADQDAPNGVAVGSDTQCDGENAVALGHSAWAVYDRSLALGAGATTTVADSGVIKVDEIEVVPSSGGSRSRASVRDSGGVKRRLATVIEEVNAVGATGATETVAEPETSSLNFWTLDADCTITFPALVAGKSFTLKLKQDATGSRTVTWPGTVLWAGGTAPTLTTTANKTDIFSFMCDGTNWFGFVAGQNY